MAYDALTIDTQIVYANGRYLDRGLVGELEQYKDGLIQVVLSEICVRELRSMLTAKAKTSVDALAKAIKEGGNNGQLSDEHKMSLQTVKDAMTDPDDHAKQQLSTFAAATGAIIIPADKAQMKPLLDAYFGKKPPFSSKGKKDEFPDSIALLSMEAWAIENGKKILAVSNDGDWQTFAAQSEHIDLVDGLAAAMASLEVHAEETEPIARAVLASIAADEPPELKAALNTEMSHAVDMETPYIEFDGPMPGEDEGGTLSLLSYEIDDLEAGTTDIDIVRVRTDGFVMQVPVFVQARAFVDINFAIYDSVDKDYVPMGSTSIERDIDFYAHALIDCTQVEEDGGTDISYEITDAQLIGAPSSIDVGYIDYSLAEQDYEFEQENLSK